MIKNLGCNERNGPFSNTSREARTPKGLSRNDLCPLCFLFVHPLVSITGRPKGKEESISIE
jgi:hypothetical protein